MRRRDLDSRDKQNFSAIEHLMSVSTLLGNIPDALGIEVYLEIVNASVNSYLDKSCSPKKNQLHMVCCFLSPLLEGMDSPTSSVYNKR